MGDMDEVCKYHPQNGRMLHTKVREQRIFIHQRSCVPEILSGSEYGRKLVQFLKCRSDLDEIRGGHGDKVVGDGWAILCTLRSFAEGRILDPPKTISWPKSGRKPDGANQTEEKVYQTYKPEPEPHPCR